MDEGLPQNQGVTRSSAGRSAGLRPEPAAPSQPKAAVTNARLGQLLDDLAVHALERTASRLLGIIGRLGRDGLLLEEWNAIVEAHYHLRAEASRRARAASGIAARSDETPESGSAEGKSPAPEGDAQ